MDTTATSPIIAGKEVTVEFLDRTATGTVMSISRKGRMITVNIKVEGPYDIGQYPGMLLDAQQGDQVLLDGRVFNVHEQDSKVYLTAADSPGYTMSQSELEAAKDYPWQHVRSNELGVATAVFSRRALFDMIVNKAYKVE